MATVTATPANPQLSVWSPGQARDAISKMERNVVDYMGGGLSSQDLDPPYSPVWLAVWTAMATNPQRAAAEGWNWKLPYFLALAGEVDLAAQIYAAAAEDALNEEGVMPEQLTSWFVSGQSNTTYLTPQFELAVEPLTVPGRDGAYLLQIGELHDIDTPGSSCWLLLNAAGQFTLNLLHNGFPQDGFSITMRNPTGCYAKDVTGDHLPEIIVDHYSGGHVGTTTIKLFDLSTGTATVMPFTPASHDQLELWNGGLPQSNQPPLGIRTWDSLNSCDG